MTTLWNPIRRGGIPLGLALAFLLGPTAAAQAQDRVTVAIHCPDGVVDSDWKITMEIKDANGNTGTVTQYVPTHTTAQAAAKGLKDQINRKFNTTGTTTTENTHPDFQKEKVNQAEDLVLPKGFRIVKVTTVKKPWEGGTWHAAFGHLQIYRGEDRINNKSHRAGDKAVDAAAGDTLGVVTLSLLGAQGEQVSVELNLIGTQDDGTPYAATFTGSYPAAASTWQIVLDLGRFAAAQGILVTYPSSSSVRLDLDSTLGRTLDGWWFSAYPDGTDPAAGGSGGAGTVSFAAESVP